MEFDEFTKFITELYLEVQILSGASYKQGILKLEDNNNGEIISKFSLISLPTIS